MATEDHGRTWPVPPGNEERRRLAATRDAATAKRILAVAGDELPGHCVAVLRARIDHPEWSWTEAAASLGLTKEAARGRFRQGQKLMARKEGTDG